jgi:hypothetical protein
MSMRGASIETIGHRFIDAFNRRDAEGLVALADPAIEFHPTSIVGSRRVYRGHEGLRRWVQDLETSEIQHQVCAREVRALDDGGFAILSEVLLGGEFVSPSAMIATLSDSGAIVEAHAYLTDEHTLTQLGLMHERPVGPS